MITNEEGYKAYCNAMISQTEDEANKNHEIVKKYFEQQIKKDRLLELYKKAYEHLDKNCRELDTNFEMFEHNQIFIEIEVLEEEMK